VSDGDPIRVVLIDDHAMVREALAAVLAEAGDIEVVGQGENASQAVAAVRAESPDVLVLDYNLPGGSALPVIEELVRLEIATRTLVLTVHESSHYAIRVLEAGAAGFMVKSSAVDELLGAIRAVAGGEIYISPRLSTQVLDHLRKPRRDRTGVNSLSSREFELLRLIAAGLSLKEVAHRLSVSVSAASTYRARILRKLGLSSTSELIRFALENDLAD
jgi:DNA-binding NarL/FixJ family response regulator